MSVVEVSPEVRPRSPWLVLLSPTGAFAAARARPRPWLTLLLVAAVATLPSMVFVSVVDLQDFLLASLRDSGRLEEMPAEAVTFLKERVAPAMTVGLPVFAALARVASILLLAGLGFALLRGISRELRFPACVTAVALGLAPLVVHDLLHATLLAVRDLAAIDPRNPVLSNPAAWLGLHVEDDPLGALLHGLDLFKLWGAWLCAQGLNVVARTRSALPYALTFGLHVLLVLVKVAGALFGEAAG